MKHVLQSERGMALAIAIVALVVVGALVAGALFSGTQEQRVAENMRRAQASFGVAEEGVYDIIRVWKDSTRKFNTLYPYPGTAGSAARPFARRTNTTKTGSYSGTLFKLNDQVYLIDMSGQDTMSLAGRIRGGGASQRIGLLSRIKTLDLGVVSALTSGGSNVVAGNAAINGYDNTPTGWAGCGPLDSAHAGLRMESDANMVINGHPVISGSPSTFKDPTLTDSSFSHFGDVTYDSLAARATITVAAQNWATGIGPATLNGTCDTGVLTNWGSPTDPTGPCGSYFPIIHVTGTGANINGREGQGILLVDGGLSVQGGFQFFGVVIIKGSLKTAGGGGTPAHFWGTVMAQDTVSLSDTTNTISGNANLLYSSCAIQRVLDNTMPGAAMRSRGWVQLF